jgi:hypothetical protein
VIRDQTTGTTSAKIRKPLQGLSDSEISGESIVDPAIRRLVQTRFEELRNLLGRSKQPKDVFASPENHPSIVNRNGSRTPIHSVRVWAQVKPEAIRRNDPTRNVVSTAGSNFCTLIVPKYDAKGNEIGWTDEPVSRRIAMLNRRGFNNSNSVVFELFIHDYVVLADEQECICVYRVLNLSKGDIEVRLHSDGRSSDSVKKAKERIRIRSGALKARSFRKVTVSPTGLIKDPETGMVIDLEKLELTNPSNQTTKWACNSPESLGRKQGG